MNDYNMIKYRNFISKFNLVNGKMEWVMFDNNYDFKSEIRNSGYADMLNDTDRNIKYYQALKEVIQKMKKENMKVHVLDIGCGTGILSMMALKLGADMVTACESFEPMYECAKRVLKKNHMLTDKINLIHCNSADLKVGLNMKEKANILVSEIFDTELIGEGVLPTFRHALQYLLTANPVVIPFKANIYIQIVDNEFLNDHSWLDRNNKYFPDLPPLYDVCRGYSSVFDIQVSSVVNHPHNTISPPIFIKEFNFSQISDSFSDKVLLSVPYRSDNTDNRLAYIMWWELVMLADTDCWISTAPKWVYNRDTDYRWRDHWLQAVYCTRHSGQGAMRSNLDFSVCHDSFSFWVEAGPPKRAPPTEKPFCTCGLHLHIPRHRLCQLNSADYHSQVDYMTRLAGSESIRNAVVVSDFSYLTVALSRSGIATHNIIDNDSVRHLTRELVEFNWPGGTSGITLSSLEDFPPVDAVSDTMAIFGDPFFIYSLLPWDNIHFWYAAEHIRKAHCRETRWRISPRKMRIKGLLVKFDHLHKINKPTESIEEFDLGPFDEIIHNDIDRDEVHFEAKFLWEYDCYARSDVCDVITIDLTESIEELYMNNVTELRGGHVFNSVDWSDTNGLVLWTVWELGDNVWLDNSLQSIDCSSGKLVWKPVTKQAVHFLTGKDVINFREIEFQCTFDIRNTDFRFSIAF